MVTHVDHWRSVIYLGGGSMTPGSADVGSAAGTGIGYLLWFWFFSSIFWGIVCMIMAHKRGRIAWVGFFSGFIFGFWSMLYYLAAGDTVEKRVAKEEAAREKYKAKRKLKVA